VYREGVSFFENPSKFKKVACGTLVHALQRGSLQNSGLNLGNRGGGGGTYLHGRLASSTAEHVVDVYK
jgi:hypothetical protein